MATAFLPLFQGCSETPAEGATRALASGEVLQLVFWAPPFAVAAWIMLATLLAHVRRVAPGRASFAILTAGIGACAVSAVVWGAQPEGGERVAFLSGAVVTIGAATRLATRAFRRQGWLRWWHLLAAYLAVTTTHVALLLWWTSIKNGMALGAVLFLAGFALLTASVGPVVARHRAEHGAGSTGGDPR